MFLRHNQIPDEIPAESTVCQLKADIDCGRTRDKLPMYAGYDPASAPLGTDEEAAGTPVAGAVVSLARRMERRDGWRETVHQDGLGAAWILFAAIVVCAAAVLGWMLLF